MLGGGVQPPATLTDAAVTAASGLPPHMLRPRRASAKQSWLPGCGQSPVQAPAAVGGNGAKGTDGGTGVLGDRADEAFTPTTVSPPAQDGSLPQQQGSQKVEAVTPSTVSSVAQNGALPLPRQQGSDKVDAVATPAAVSPIAQNGTLPQQGGNKVEELVAPAAVSPAMHSDTLPCALPWSGPDRARQDGNTGENGEAQLLSDAGELLSDGQEGNWVVEVASPAIAVMESYGIVGASSVHNSDQEACLLVAEEQGHGGSGVVGQEEVAADGDVVEMGNKAGGSELQRMENGIAGSRRKRLLKSAVNPPPKKWAVSPVLELPPGCGWTAVTTKVCRVLEVSSVHTFPPFRGRATATTTDNGVMEVAPIGTFAPGCSMSAVNTTGSGDEGSLIETTTVNNGNTLAASLVLGGADSLTFELEASNKKLECKRMVDEGQNKAHNRVQVGDGSLGTKQDGNQRNVVAKAALSVSNWKVKEKRSSRKGKQVPQAVVDDQMKNRLDGSLQTSFSDWKIKAKRSSREGKHVPQAVVNDQIKLEGSLQRSVVDWKTKAKRSPREGKQVPRAVVDDKMKHSLEGSLQRINLRTPLSDSIDAMTKGNVLESGKMNATMLGNVEASAKGKVQSKILSSKKEVMCSNLKIKQKKFARKLKGLGVGKDNLHRSARVSKLGKHVATNQIEESYMNNDDTNLEDDDNSRVLVVYGEKREISVTPSVPSGSHRKQHGDHIDARSKVRKLLQLYQATYRKLTHLEEQGIPVVGRIYLEAAKAVKKDPVYTKLGAVVGNIPGVEVGDEFHYRIELSIVGLHRPYQGGIDTCKVNGVPVAISVVASGGYPDELSSSGEIVYTGSGGKAGGNKDGSDQKLERGNLALKNCIETKTPVRVIHGFKVQSRSEVGKKTWTFTYDGLYEVVECWQEGPKGGMVFKYKLQRIAGQPELALHAIKAIRKSKVREGLCLPDISQGSERIPICVINTIDDMRLAPFKYITKVAYPTWYKNEPQKGCNCTNLCSDSIRCACAVKNGGEIPFNRDNAIVKAKRLVYECGPWCRCPPTCYNRVSQHGIKIPLEIFKTGKTGWGVRSLSSISSGSFICEYTGKLLDGEEAANRQNDEYLFDIGRNYNDEELWRGIEPVVDVQSSTSSSSGTMKGFTIDAAECGNVGRFINHSCSPNLYAQNVLWDHDDMRKPHVMFFALENIPPLQELTYHYNYEVGSVLDENGNEKVKHCYCGASDCRGRLY